MEGLIKATIQAIERLITKPTMKVHHPSVLPETF